MPIQDTLDRIRRFADRKKLRPSRLALLAGLHPNALRHMREPTWCPRADTIEKLERFIAESRRPAKEESAA